MLIERSQERIHTTGEIFTPEWLVDELLIKLYNQNNKIFNIETNFLDPAAGDGNILVRILYFKLKYNQGCCVKKILSSIYGVDLMPDNIKYCHERMFAIISDFENITLEKAIEKYKDIIEHNIVCHDSLKWNFNEWKPKSLAASEFFTFI